MNDKFVMVPREQLQAAYDETVDTRYHQEWMREILAKPAEQHQGDPVAWTWQGSLDTLRGYCPAGVAVFPHKSPGTPIPLYTCPAAEDHEDAERLRADLAQMTTFRDNAANHMLRIRAEATVFEKERDALRTQLADAHALLREIHDGRLSGHDRWLKIEAALSASAEPSAPVELETGERLDAIGELYGVQRDGKSDASYRSEVEARIRSIGERRPGAQAVIPEGWVLVPMVPTERMLTEFSGVWAAWLPKDRRNLELEAYAAMLQVVPTPPIGGDSEIESLRKQVKRLRKQIGISKAETRKAYKKLEYAWSKIRATEASDDSFDRQCGPCSSSGSRSASDGHRPGAGCLVPGDQLPPA